MIQEVILALLLVLVVGVIVLIVAMVKNSGRKANHEAENVQQQVSENLLVFQTNLLNAMRHDMNTLNENTTSHLQTIEKNVNEHIHTGFKSTNEVFQNVMKEIVKIDETQNQLKALSKDISGLNSVLNDKKTRGIYGEIELYTLLESAFGDNPTRFEKQYRLSNGLIVDAAIFGNDALGVIPVDSKFPLENYNRLQDTEINTAQKKVIQNEFKNDVKKHILAIADKYLIPNETSEFAYMFIPAEAVFSYINAYLPEVLQYSYEKKVYLVSPTTLMAYITAIKALYLNQRKNEKMQDIQEELVKLADEFKRFAKRYENVQKDFTKTAQEMQEVLITANKIMRRFERIENVELDKEEV